MLKPCNVVPPALQAKSRSVTRPISCPSEEKVLISGAKETLLIRIPRLLARLPTPFPSQGKDASE